VVNIPFRARTVCEMVLEGSQSDLSLPKDAKQIAFHVAPARMKTRERFDADVEDDKLSKPRKILDWFIAGPRKELLRNPKLLPEASRRPERLFGGIGEARYNRILGAWTEEVGMLMTTHMFRHALASFLINCCGVPVADAARMLGNSIAVAERKYVYLDVIKRRSNTLKKIADHRQHLADLQHPGRRRKK
jgi:integrase